METKSSFSYATTELLTPDGLAERIIRSRRWVIINTRPDAQDPIPHLRFGRVARYAWGSPELESWLRRRKS
jgi:hypothetical protein